MQIAKERKAQIDEGVALARKVDALRETLGNLEAQQTSFLNGMQSELHNRTNHLIEKIAGMERDVLDLEEKRKELLKPLSNEWAEVNMKRAEIDSIKLILDKNLSKTAEKEQKLTLLGNGIKERLSRIKVRERELDKVYLSADEVKNDIENIKLDILKQKESQIISFEQANKKLLQREKDIESRQFTLDNRLEQIEIAEKEIKEEKIRLLDQRQTLERAMARINNK